MSRHIPLGKRRRDEDGGLLPQLLVLVGIVVLFVVLAVASDALGLTHPDNGSAAMEITD